MPKTIDICPGGFEGFRENEEGEDEEEVKLFYLSNF